MTFSDWSDLSFLSAGNTSRAYMYVTVYWYYIIVPALTFNLNVSFSGHDSTNLWEESNLLICYDETFFIYK